MQVDLQAVKMSIDTWTGSLKDDITDTKKDFHETIANTRNYLHEELGLVLQVETQTTKALTEATQCKFQTQLKRSRCMG
jgi:hypothetical protein